MKYLCVVYLILIVYSHVIFNFWRQRKIWRRRAASLEKVGFMASKGNRGGGPRNSRQDNQMITAKLSDEEQN